ncbi:hypothetical protein EII17_13625 [Clostridiales bacterium COT073_COT-073]|nr:hypothetical protein EII17_13625 [Clostridiales bacterium COT073_COT-073]
MPYFKCNMISYVLKRAVDITIIIPGITSSEAEMPGVSHAPKWKFPVLYLLHGYWGDYSSWGRYTSIERYAEERRIAVVTFSGENNMYMNLNDVKKENPIDLMFEPDYERFLMHELPEFVTSLFPISKKPADTYLAGLSMGGFGALTNGFRHPQKFRAIGAFSPLPTQRKTEYRTKAEIPEYLQKYEPIWLIKKAMKSPKMPDLYYCYGGQDFLFDMQEWFREKLEESQVPHTLEFLPEYGHEWAFWDMQVARFLDWLPRTDSYYLEQKKRKI